MKKRKMLILAIASTLIIGGTIVAVKNKDLFGGIASTKISKHQRKAIGLFEEHETEMADFVKSRNPKVTSVQFD